MYEFPTFVRVQLSGENRTTANNCHRLPLIVAPSVIVARNFRKLRWPDWFWLENGRCICRLVFCLYEIGKFVIVSCRTPDARIFGEISFSTSLLSKLCVASVTREFDVVYFVFFFRLYIRFVRTYVNLPK